MTFTQELAEIMNAAINDPVTLIGLVALMALVCLIPAYVAYTEYRYQAHKEDGYGCKGNSSNESGSQEARSAGRG